MKNLDEFIQNAPKAELHVHLEGTLEPETIAMLAKRNNIELEYTVEELKAQRRFVNLDSFLTLYCHNVHVLITEQDFTDLLKAYCDRVSQAQVRHVELFFEFEGHVVRGIAIETIINGLIKGVEYANNKGISCGLILTFFRERDPAYALAVLDKVLPYRDYVCGIGLASSEKGHPPLYFEAIFHKARALGFNVVCHAGEEGPPAYIWQALTILHAQRIDHGNACVKDPELIAYLAEHQIPLTMCPFSNVALHVIESLHDHPAKYLLEKGVCVSIHSDDPAYFGGYIDDNLKALARALSLTRDEIAQLLRNSFTASFLPHEKKKALLDELEEYIRSW